MSTNSTWTIKHNFIVVLVCPIFSCGRGIRGSLQHESDKSYNRADNSGRSGRVLLSSGVEQH